MMCDDCVWEEALGMVDQLTDLLGELPERAEDFAEAVEKKAESIGAWITANQHVTDAQFKALENMIAGAEAWLTRE